MLIDFPTIRRAFEFVPANAALVLTGAGLYGLMFAVLSHFVAVADVGDLHAILPALGLVLLTFAAFVVAMAAWGRAALAKPAGPLLGLAFGSDELKLLLAALLVLILSFTVLGTAGLAVYLMSFALAAINVDLEAPAPVEGEVSAFAFYGVGEWIVFSVIIAVYVLFSLWFFTRLALAYPATLDAGRIQIMRIWPMSGKGRAVRILTTVFATILPGAIILELYNYALASSLGLFPAVAHSVSGQAGEHLVSAPLFFALSFAYGVGQAAFIGAPVCAALCALYCKLKDAPPTAGF